ncbi:hypothetical protein BGZ83_003566 [Gryganskiella cystojenkinii]|nr:hypothetical protein BGZ83_003566 [Gryganskiella cystojenkinii]
MTATTFTNSLPSPAISICTLDLTLLPPIPSGPLTNETRVQRKEELDQIKKCSSESQIAYNTAHASITAYQELVLTTHAQVAAAKQALLRAKGIASTGSSSNVSSNSTSSASSPPSPSSPLNSHLVQQQQEILLKGCVDDHERNLQRLEQEHVDLGLKLSQVLRDKAEAEETKKRLNDYMLRAKSRIKEIEQKLRE